MSGVVATSLFRRATVIAGNRSLRAPMPQCAVHSRSVATAVNVTSPTRIATPRQLFKVTKFYQPLLRLGNPFISSRSFADSVQPYNVDFYEFRECVGQHEYFVVDVREPKELADDGRILGCTNIPLGQVDSEFSKPASTLMTKFHRPFVDEKGANIIFFCRAGVRAEKAMHMAHKHGYSRARFYKGSFLDWVEKGGVVTKA